MAARARRARTPFTGARAAQLGLPAGARYTQELRPIRLVGSLAASRCAGTNRRLIPSPLLFMLQSRDGLRACAAPPTLATHGGVEAYGAGPLRRPRLFTSGSAGVSGRLRVLEDALEGAPARGGEWAGACRLRTDAGLPRWSAGLCSGDLWRIALLVENLRFTDLESEAQHCKQFTKCWI